MTSSKTGWGDSVCLNCEHHDWCVANVNTSKPLPCMKVGDLMLEEGVPESAGWSFSNAPLGEDAEAQYVDKG